MNKVFYLAVFAVCIAAICGPGSTVTAAPSSESDHSLFRYESANRIVRQAPPSEKDIPPPPNFPPPPAKVDDYISRKKREAKGVGGSMPTRRG